MVLGETVDLSYQQAFARVRYRTLSEMFHQSEKIEVSVHRLHRPQLPVCIIIFVGEEKRELPRRTTTYIIRK